MSTDGQGKPGIPKPNADRPAQPLPTRRVTEGYAEAGSASRITEVQIKQASTGGKAGPTSPPPNKKK